MCPALDTLLQIKTQNFDIILRLHIYCTSADSLSRVVWSTSCVCKLVHLSESKQKLNILPFVCFCCSFEKLLEQKKVGTLDIENDIVTP